MRSLEGVAADVTPGSTYALQITDGTSVYFPARTRVGPSSLATSGVVAFTGTISRAADG